VLVCDGDGKNCVEGGNTTVGTIAIVGTDANKNRILRYTAPTSVPVPPACATVPDGCLLKLKVKLRVAKVTRKAGATVSATATNPIPFLASLSPDRDAAGSPAFTLTVDGNGFVGGAVIRWNGSDRVTTFGSDTQVTAAIPAADLAAPDSVLVTAFNPGPQGGESNALTFNVNPGPPRLVERSSVSASGTEGAQASGAPALNGSGRYLAFVSDAPDLVTGDGNGVTDVFWRDTCLGNDGCTTKTRRVSVSTAGTEANAAGSDPAISADGRFVAFLSLANNLVSGDTNGAVDVFLHDTCAGAGGGCTPSTTRVSVSTAGAQGNGGAQGAPAVSADGRFVAFASNASNLVGNDTNGVTDVFLRDTCQGAGLGCTPSTIRISVAKDGSEANGPSLAPAVSADGRRIAFHSDADNLLNNDSNDARDVFVRDTCLGAGPDCAPRTILISVNKNGDQGNGLSSNPSISADGRFVAFASDATNLVGNDTNAARDIFVRDTCRGGGTTCTPKTRRASVGSDGAEANAASANASISGDGRLVVFTSLATNLVAGDTNAARDVFVRDFCLGVKTGCTRTTLRLSVSGSGAEANDGSFEPSLSRSGHFVAYRSLATNLLAGDTNAVADVFLGRTGR